MRIGFLGPQGTFSHQALLALGVAPSDEAIALPTIYDTVMAVQEGTVDRALVPIENSLEGSVDVTLDALATEASDVTIVGEYVLAVRNCLLAAREIELEQIEKVYSHPQPNAQCAQFLRTRLHHADVVAVSSTADAVQTVLGAPQLPHAALGNALAAELYGAKILVEGVDDSPDNQTRFVWLAPLADAKADPAATKTALVFWGAGDESPGWLVRCLSEFSQRDVSLTRIESRPRRIGLGNYMFFADLAGGVATGAVAEAIKQLRTHAEEVRILGSYH